ncbi:MAG: radical SAM protein [Sandaracinaceae bacterium]|nr:radical SAM protein [Sandaracinaceae bacterium]
MACNERCVFCNVPVEDFRPVTPSLAALAAELDAFIASGEQTLTISGGEPTLLRERLLDVVARARAAGVPFVELQTNAVLLDDDYAQALARAGVTSAFVSFLSHASPPRRTRRARGRLCRLPAWHGCTVGRGHRGDAEPGHRSRHAGARGRLRGLRRPASPPRPGHLALRGAATRSGQGQPRPAPRLPGPQGAGGPRPGARERQRDSSAEPVLRAPAVRGLGRVRRAQRGGRGSPRAALAAGVRRGQPPEQAPRRAMPRVCPPHPLRRRLERLLGSARWEWDRAAARPCGAVAQGRQPGHGPAHRGGPLSRRASGRRVEGRGGTADVRAPHDLVHDLQPSARRRCGAAPRRHHGPGPLDHRRGVQLGARDAPRAE